MGFQLTPASLRKLCKDLKLYTAAPELNDILHLQCKGITKLQHLDEYTGLKTLYLEQNAISEIENLDKLVELKCLYLGKNVISQVSGLSTLTNLETLDLSDNFITTVSGLDCLPRLSTLNLSGNKMRSYEDVSHLASCPSLTSLDLGNCRLEDTRVLEEMLFQKPLLFLRLQGNPLVSSLKHYRKRTIAAMPILNYLDDAPIFPRDRRLAIAFCEGGLEAERSMRDTIRAEEEAIREGHRAAFDAMVERAKQTPPQPHDPMRFRAVPPGESESDEEGIPAPYRRKGSKRTPAQQQQQQQQQDAQGAGAQKNGGQPHNEPLQSQANASADAAQAQQQQQQQCEAALSTEPAADPLSGSTHEQGMSSTAAAAAAAAEPLIPAQIPATATATATGAGASSDMAVPHAPSAKLPPGSGPSNHTLPVPLPNPSAGFKEELTRRARERAAARAETAQALQQQQREEEAAFGARARSVGGAVSASVPGAVCLGPVSDHPSYAAAAQHRSTPQQNGGHVSAGAAGLGEQNGSVASSGTSSWQQEADDIAARAISGGIAGADSAATSNGSNANGAADENGGTAANGQMRVDARFHEHSPQGLPPRPRPFVWGSPAYRQLWQKAMAVGETQEAEASKASEDHPYPSSGESAHPSDTSTTPDQAHAPQHPSSSLLAYAAAQPANSAAPPPAHSTATSTGHASGDDIFHFPDGGAHEGGSGCHNGHEGGGHEGGGGSGGHNGNDVFHLPDGGVHEGGSGGHNGEEGFHSGHEGGTTDSVLSWGGGGAGHTGGGASSSSEQGGQAPSTAVSRGTSQGPSASSQAQQGVGSDLDSARNGHAGAHSPLALHVLQREAAASTTASAALDHEVDDSAASYESTGGTGVGTPSEGESPAPSPSAAARQQHLARLQQRQAGLGLHSPTRPPTATGGGATDTDSANNAPAGRLSGFAAAAAAAGGQEGVGVSDGSSSGSEGDLDEEDELGLGGFGMRARADVDVYERYAVTSVGQGQEREGLGLGGQHAEGVGVSSSSARQGSLPPHSSARSLLDWDSFLRSASGEARSHALGDDALPHSSVQSLLEQASSAAREPGCDHSLLEQARAILASSSTHTGTAVNEGAPGQRIPPFWLRQESAHLAPGSGQEQDPALAAELLQQARAVLRAECGGNAQQQQQQQRQQGGLRTPAAAGAAAGALHREGAGQHGSTQQGAQSAGTTPSSSAPAPAAGLCGGGRDSGAHAHSTLLSRLGGTANYLEQARAVVKAALRDRGNTSDHTHARAHAHTHAHAHAHASSAGDSSGGGGGAGRDARPCLNRRESAYTYAHSDTLLEQARAALRAGTPPSAEGEGAAAAAAALAAAEREGQAGGAGTSSTHSSEQSSLLEQARAALRASTPPPVGMHARTDTSGPSTSHDHDHNNHGNHHQQQEEGDARARAHFCALESSEREAEREGNRQHTHAPERVLSPSYRDSAFGGALSRDCAASLELDSARLPEPLVPPASMGSVGALGSQSQHQDLYELD